MKRMCVCVRNSVLKHGCLQKRIKRYQFSWTDLNGHADHASACFPELTRSATLLLQENNAAAVTHIPCVLLQAAHVRVSRRLHRRFFFFFFEDYQTSCLPVCTQLCTRSHQLPLSLVLWLVYVLPPETGSWF